MADLTSKFVRVIRSIEGRPISGLNVDLYQGATKIYDLTEDSVTVGSYYVDDAASGEYDIWINGVLYISGIFHSGNKLRLVQNNFDDTNVKMNPTGMNNQIKAISSVSTPVPDYVGQIGMDNAGRLHIASATDEPPYWIEVTLNDGVTLDSEDDGTLKIKSLGIGTGQIADLSITTGKIADLAVTTGKIADNAVSRDKIGSDCAGDGLTVNEFGALIPNLDNSSLGLNMDYEIEVKDLGVATSKIVDLAVTTGKVANNAITGAKIDPTIAGDGLRFKEADETIEIYPDNKTLGLYTDFLAVNWNVMAFYTELNPEAITISATVMHNSMLTATALTITHISTGLYEIVLNGADLTANKTLISLTSKSDNAMFLQAWWVNTTTIRVSARNTSGSLSDTATSIYVKITVFKTLAGEVVLIPISDMTNKLFWIDPSKISAVDADKWYPDLPAGAGNYFWNSSSGAAIEVTALNGINVYTPTGSLYLRLTDASGYYFIPASSNWTMLMVIKNTSGPAISKYDGGTNKLFWVGTSTTFKVTIRDAEGDDLDVITTENITDWTVVTVTYDDSTKTLTVYVNGLTFTDTNASYSNAGWQMISSRLFLNGQGASTTASTFGTGTGIAEWVVSTDKKSLSDINSLAGYLANKYGLTWTNIS